MDQLAFTSLPVLAHRMSSRILWLSVGTPVSSIKVVELHIDPLSMYNLPCHLSPGAYTGFSQVSCGSLWAVLNPPSRLFKGPPDQEELFKGGHKCAPLANEADWSLWQQHEVEVHT